ncbi:hypothetical protein BPUN_3138 [Candidatus Paraburkholderia kirkii]|nr:hypothetical protein BPUN_3138 [Candidatus Paraburkholderia kirkii]
MQHYRRVRIEIARTRQQENAVKYFNRLANREFLVLVAIVASALTVQVRQHVVGNDARPAQSSRASDGRLCEPPAPGAKKMRVLPADCGIRANCVLLALMRSGSDPGKAGSENARVCGRFLIEVPKAS